MQSRLATIGGVFLAAAGVVGCYDFHLTGAEDPPAVPSKLVSVAVEYHQNRGCANSPDQCENAVIFEASWMRSGGQFALTRDATGLVWRGTALAVPVNFPPSGEPYQVTVYDPHLAHAPTAGKTGNNIMIGGQLVHQLIFEGTTAEAGLVFIDLDGVGHNPL